jgi:hypothetical protein
MTVAIEIAMKDTCRPNRILRSQQDVLGGSSPSQFSQIVTKNQMQRFLVKYHTSRKSGCSQSKIEHEIGKIRLQLGLQRAAGPQRTQNFDTIARMQNHLDLMQKARSGFCL